MARPLKDGLDYWPLDVGFQYTDEIKLLKGEFGPLALWVVLALYDKAYGDHGYFLPWGNDRCILMSEGVGCGCTPQYISEVVSGCLRRSLFDERVLNVSGVLTSAGIQRRYIRAVSSREQIPIISEYWLLDAGDIRDVPAGILKKLAFKSVSGTGNPVKKQRNPVKKQINPQSKGEESKVKESRAGQGGGAAGENRCVQNTNIMAALISEYGDKLTGEYIKKAERYKYTGTRAVEKAREWLAEDKAKGTLKIPAEKAPPSYDLDAYGEMVKNYTPVYKKGGEDKA